MNQGNLQNFELVEKHKIGAKSVVEAKSLVAKYEVLMKERAPEKLTADRAHLLFEMVQNVLPHLGVFKPLLSAIMEEIYDLIFSKDHLTSSNGAMGRLPYFMVLDKQVKAEDSQRLQMTREKELLQESLFKKNEQFEEAMETIAARNLEISQLQESLAHFKALSQEQASQIETVTSHLAAVQSSSDAYGGQLQRQITRLESALAERNIEVDFLQDYKDGYNETSEAFRETVLATDLGALKTRRSVEYSKREELIGDIQTAMKMEEDLLNITNTIIDQFDDFMEEHTETLAAKDLTPSDDPAHVRAIDRDLERTEQELWNAQETFRRNMNGLDTELGLIRKHTVMLEEKLERALQEEREQKLARQKNRRAAAEKKRQAAQKDKPQGPVTELGDTEDKVGDNPFVPHERVFSKYAVQLFYSQDEGKTFFLHQNCQHCEGCQAQTISCPHKVMKQAMFAMPHKVTHIRLVRPPVKLTRDFMEESKAPPTASTVIRLASGFRGMSGKRRGTRSSVSGMLTSPTAGGSTAPMSALMKYPLVKVWDEFKSRSTEMRQIYRTLTKERVESLLEQFLAYTVWTDGHGQSGMYFNIMDSLFNFFAERYLTEEARNYAVQDFLSGLLLHEPESKMLSLFAHTLVGNIDLSVMRYLLLVADLVNSVPWQHLEDFRILLSALHPLLHEDDLDTLQMGYTSYADNKISGHRVYDYILFMIFKGREPLFVEMEQQVAQYPSRVAGLMNEEEFTDVVDQTLQLCDEKMTRRLWGEAEASINVDPYVETLIPMERLTHMLAYMHTTESFSRIQRTLSDEIGKAHSSKEGTSKDTAQSEEAPLMGMATVHQMAFNFARRDAFRKIH